MSLTIIALQWWSTIVIIIFISPFVSQQASAAIGPSNITRAVGEKSVYIPCPYAGPYNPFWKINDIYYEASSLPDGIVAASYGLLITYVNKGMNGSTFQCFVSELQNSSIGILTVVEIPEEYQEDFEVMPQIVYMPRIYIDHQRTVFNNYNKSFAWKAISNSCENADYQITSSTCDGRKIWHYHEEPGNKNTIIIPSKDLVDRNTSKAFFLSLDAFDSGGTVCLEAQQFLVVDQSDVTYPLQLSHYGLCVDLVSISTSYLVLPLNSTDPENPDCFCPILSDFSRCACVYDTIFQKSLSVSKVNDVPATYELCFLNLTTEMNNTIIHTFESLRSCYNKYGRPVGVSYRMYHKSFKIIVVLPNPPIVYYNTTTGGVEFISEEYGEIKLSHYQVIITDVTNQSIFNMNYSNNTNYATIGDLFQQPICSPYVLSVRAHNAFGFSEAPNQTISNSQQGTQNPVSDLCTCVKQNVHVDLDIMEEDRVQVNCSQVRYESNVMLKVSAELEYNATVTCDGDMQSAEFDHGSIKCGRSHLLLVYWISDHNGTSECSLNKVTKHLMCSGNKQLVTGLAAALGASNLVFVFILCIIIMCVCVKKKRRGKLGFQHHSNEAINSAND